MPIPSPSPGQSRSEFIRQCMASIGHEHKNNISQAVAICESRYRDKRAKASYVVTTADDEYISDDDDS